MTNSAETAIPRHPSNRRVIQQMELWGWEPGKTNGNWVTMWGPPIGKMLGEQIKVRPAVQHDANPTSVFLKVYSLTTDGNPERFWRGPSDTWRKSVAEAKERLARERREEQQRSAERAAARAARAAITAPEKAEPSALPVPVPVPIPVPTAPEQQGERMAGTTEQITQERVIAFLKAQAPKAISVKDFLVYVGVDPRDRKAYVAVNNRLNQLCVSRLACKPERGQFAWAAAQPAPLAPPPTPPAEPPTPSEPPPPPTVSAPTVVSTAASMDDTIEAVLDLLLPGGFKASHLRFIAPWIEATKAMVLAVEGA